jgi:hypothetical protein
MSKAIQPVDDITTIFHPENSGRNFPMMSGCKYTTVCIADVMGGKCGKHDK